MGKTQRIKRKAVGRILWHTVGIMESCMYHLGDHLHVEGPFNAHRNNPLKGALTEREFNLIGQRIKKIREYIEDLRKIAKHLERGTDENK